MPDGVHCVHCSQEYGIARVADVMSHGGYTPSVLCWEHVRYCDAPVHPLDEVCEDTCPIGQVGRPYLQPSGALVSIITPTWGRHDLLMEQIENVRMQTYRPLEHVIVSDGLDEHLAVRILNADLSRAATDPRIRFLELGRHWSSELDESYAAAPVMVGQLLARGAYQQLWADDERAAPFFIELMVKALETTGSDFAYPRVAYYRWEDPLSVMGIGCSPPLKGGITTLLYRRELLNLARGPYRTHIGRENDWEFVERAMTGGASHVFVDRAVFSHRDDRDCPPDLYTAPIPEYVNA